MFIMSLCTGIFRKDERPQQKKIAWGGDRHPHKQTKPWTDFATTRKNWPKGRFFENCNNTLILTDLEPNPTF